MFAWKIQMCEYCFCTLKTYCRLSAASLHQVPAKQKTCADWLVLSAARKPSAIAAAIIASAAANCFPARRRPPEKTIFFPRRREKKCQRKRNFRGDSRNAPA
jgi:hypothetical protein